MPEILAFISVFNRNELAWNMLLSGFVVILTFIVIKGIQRVADKIIARRKDDVRILNPELWDSTVEMAKTFVFYGGYFLAFLIILQIFNYNIIYAGEIKKLGFAILKVVLVFLGAKLAIRYLKTVVKYLIIASEKNYDKTHPPRIKTLGGLLNSIITYGIFLIAGIMILEILSINTTAILASIGVLGLAVGFGAQNLIKDIIAGFFIVFEDQFRVDEYIEAGGAIGIVKEIGLRTTKIKRWTGQLEIIPNGEIIKVSNYSRNNMLAVVVVGIAYEEELDKAQEILRKLSQKAYDEIDAIVEVPVVQGVIELADSSVNVRVIAKTKPGEQWQVQRDLLGLFKNGLDEAGIEIPFPRRVIYQRQEKQHEQV